MKRKIFLVSFTFAAAVAASLFLSPRSAGMPENPRTANVNGVSLHLAVADSAQERARGLSGREILKDNEGMFFVFDKSGRHGMWMKDMRTAIDILWLDEDGTIIHLEENVEPETYPRVFYPPRPARFVLEAASGTVERVGVNIGDRVAF